MGMCIESFSGKPLLAGYRRRVSLRSKMDSGRAVELDLWLRYVDSLLCQIETEYDAVRNVLKLELEKCSV